MQNQFVRPKSCVTGQARVHYGAMSTKLSTIFLFVVLAALTLPSLAQQGCSAGSDYVISKVALPADTALSGSQQGEVRVRLVGRCIQKSELGEMSERVRDAYQSFGFFQAAVGEPEVTVVDAFQKPAVIGLRFHVKEGSRFRLRKVEFQGARAFSPDELLSISPLAIDDVFDTSKVRELLEGLRRAYAAKGYSQLVVVPQTKIDGAYGIELTLVVDENGSSVLK